MTRLIQVPALEAKQPCAKGNFVTAAFVTGYITPPPARALARYLNDLRFLNIVMILSPLCVDSYAYIHVFIRHDFLRGISNTLKV